MRKAFILLIVGLALGCRPSRNSVAPDGPAFTPQQQPGQAIFQANCNRCHPGGNRFVGPSLHQPGLTAELIRAQVRSGKGIMPAFSREKISDPDLEDLISYVLTFGPQK